MKIEQIPKFFVVLALLLTGCSVASSATEVTSAEGTGLTGLGTNAAPLALPSLAAISLDGRPLRVLATTSIIGDVVAQVGGQTIQLTTLMAPGQDPHSYQPGAQALTAAASADVIFVNGWDLEEALVADVAAIGAGVPVVPISANITPLLLGGSENGHKEETAAPDEAEDGHSGPDPHVWFSIPNVLQWVDNVAQVLGDLDPANAKVYEQNAAAYKIVLENLQREMVALISQIPSQKRVLVTNHDTFGYFAQTYAFTVAGTIIPAASTLAEPSASDLTALIGVMQEQELCTLFTETTISADLAETIAAELDHCPGEVQVLPLHTGALGAPGSGADSYIGMFRANLETIVRGLGE